MKPVKIHWTDTVGQGDDAWLTSEEVVAIKPCLMVTVGYILVNSDTHVTVAATKAVEDGEDVYGNVNCIPKTCITAVTGLCCGDKETCASPCEEK